MYRPVVFCLLLTSFLQLSRCSCIRTRKRDELTGAPSDRETFLCYNSKDFKTDLKKAQVDEPLELEFEFADIPKLENNALEMLPKLEKLGLLQCNIKEIEDKAFHGLSELKSLDLSENHLTTLKGIWFKELKLERLYLRYNAIETIDEQFVDTMLAMEKMSYVNLMSNRLKNLPTNFGSLLNRGFVNMEFNPWSYKQALLTSTQLKDYYVYPGFDELKYNSHNASVKCNNSLGMDVTDDVFDNCVSDILVEQYKRQRKV